MKRLQVHNGTQKSRLLKAQWNFSAELIGIFSMQSWQLLYNASSLRYRGLWENCVFSETEKTQLQTPQSSAGMGIAVVGRGHGQMCYFKQNLRWGCVLSHRKSVVLVRTVNHATRREIHTASPHDFCFQQFFFPPLKWLAYILVLLICNIVASALWFCWWKAGGSPGVWAMLLSQRLPPCVSFQEAGRQREREGGKNVLLTSVKTTLGWIILLCTSTAHSL